MLRHIVKISNRTLIVTLETLAVLALLLSIAFGAFVAGRTAPDRGGLHGVLTWTLTTLLTTWLLAGLASSVVGTAGNVVGKGLSAAGSGIAAAALFWVPRVAPCGWGAS